MKYRSRIDIISVILDAANGRGGGPMKTKIMYQAYLSHDQMKEYLTVLTERFLDAYNQMSDVMKTEQQQQQL